MTIALHGSPWHLYGPDSRIMTIDKPAEVLQQESKKKKKLSHVVLMSSWSGTAPDKHYAPASVMKRSAFAPSAPGRRLMPLRRWAIQSPPTTLPS
ncbi:hypothetical protein [Pseudoduganella sp. R-43]|uniref:hypothetical protein n=1 Tax=unclassified Pseudoduganella TaxID=2637179 RepID=UPI003CE89ED5